MRIDAASARRPTSSYAALTACAFSSTFSRCLTASKITAGLSMLGLPCLDNMRCRLLAGLFVNSERVSNPTVALTRSHLPERSQTLAAGAAIPGFD